MHEYLDQMI